MSRIPRIIVCILCACIVVLTIAALETGSILSMKATLSASVLTHRDLINNIPTNVAVATTIVPDVTSIATSIATEAISAGESIASVVTSAVGQVTEVPSIEIGLNVSSASVQFHGFGNNVALHDSFFTIPEWLNVALQLIALCIALASVFVDQFNWLLLPALRAVLALSWTLSVLLLAAIAALGYIVDKVNEAWIQHQVIWEKGFAFSIVVLLCSSVQIFLPIRNLVDKKVITSS